MQNNRCLIESLPLELLLPVLAYLPDLASLDSLLTSSPAVYRAFETQSLYLFTTVFSSGNTDRYNCALIRIIALIRANLLPATVHDLETFRILVLHETTTHRWDPPIWAHPTSSWPSNMSTNIIRGLLSTNRKVQRLMDSCLEHYLARFRSLRPFHSPEFTLRSKSYTEYLGWDVESGGVWNDKQENTIFHYPVEDVGPPSWQEQQRAMRAFWHIELSNTLQTSVETSFITLPGEEGRIGPEDMIATGLCDAGAICTTSDMLRYREWCHSETTLEEELLNSVSEYTHNADSISDSS